MTQDDVKRLLTVMVTSYPNYKPENMKLTINVWHEMLKDYPYDDTMLALKSFIATDTSGFAPSIGQLIEKISMINQTNYMNEQEAWALVRNAISNSTYHAKEEFDKLPEPVQRAVGNSNQLYVWATDSEYNEGVISSHFIAVYKTICKRMNEEAKLPKEARLRLDQLRQQALAKKERLAVGCRE